MIIDIGEIIISRINTLPFLDKFAGVVKVLSYINVDKNGKWIKNTFPASCKSPINLSDCDTSRYLDLCPDDKKKSVLYLEDKGIRFRKTEGQQIYFTASVDLVLWLNLPLLGVSDCSFSARCSAAIISLLIGKGVPFQSGIYQMVSIKPVFEQPKSNNPFVKYTYNEISQQLLMYPYDHLVLSLDIEFMINAKCIDQIILNPPIPCLTK